MGGGVSGKQGGRGRGTHGDAAVAADDGDDDRGREREVFVDLRHEGRCADDVEGGHAEQPATPLN